MPFARLGEILHPTLIVTGDDDAIIPPANSRLLAERIPNARLVVLPGARHDFTTDQPVESGRAVVEFLTRCPRSRHARRGQHELSTVGA
jgi:pimeloyl-ACP methyl ester carboxylesterase